jgi:hypothetical protein
MTQRIIYQNNDGGVLLIEEIAGNLVGLKD